MEGAMCRPTPAHTHPPLPGLTPLQSIKFHEAGKKHKETVEKYFIDQRRKKIKDERNEQEIERELAKVDRVGLFSPTLGCRVACAVVWMGVCVCVMC
jgi:hypothetical protein